MVMMENRSLKAEIAGLSFELQRIGWLFDAWCETMRLCFPKIFGTGEGG